MPPKGGNKLNYRQKNEVDSEFDIFSSNRDLVFQALAKTGSINLQNSKIYTTIHKFTLHTKISANSVELNNLELGSKYCIFHYKLTDSANWFKAGNWASNLTKVQFKNQKTNWINQNTPVLETVVNWTEITMFVSNVEYIFL